MSTSWPANSALFQPHDCSCASSRSSAKDIHPLNSARPSHSKAVKTIHSQQTKTSRQRLSRPHRARDTASSKHDTGQQGELDTVGLSVGDAVASECVQSANCDTCGHAGDGAGADVASYAAACGQGGEDVCGCSWRCQIGMEGG